MIKTFSKIRNFVKRPINPVRIVGVNGRATVKIVVYGFNFAVFWISSAPVYGLGYSEYMVNAKLAGISCPGVSIPDDVIATVSNPAGLPFTDGINISLDYSQLYNLSQLPYQVVSLTFPGVKDTLGTTRHKLGLLISHFGFDEYRETNVNLAHGIKIRDIFSIGYRLRYFTLNIKDGNNITLLSGDIGLFARVNERINFAVLIPNLGYTSLNVYADRLPVTLNVGISYTHANSFRSILELAARLYPTKYTNTPDVSAGQEFFLTQNFTFRTGVRNNPLRLSLGFGVSWDKIGLDYAVIYRPEFEPEHHITVGWSIGTFFSSRNIPPPEPVFDNKPDIKIKIMNLNTATVDELTELGFTIIESENIIRYRNQIGRFNKIDDLFSVPLIDETKVMRLKESLSVGE